MAHIKLSIGRLYWGAIRDYVSQQRFLGAPLELHESSGFLERDFIIKGPDEAVRAAQRDIDKWMHDLPPVPTGTAAPA